MEKELITRLHKNFEDFVHNEDGVEFWFARDIQAPLGYTRWENFLTAIERAKESCKNAENKVEDHFLGVTKMVDIGSETKREIQDIKLIKTLSLCWSLCKPRNHVDVLGEMMNE
jgi:DNA-damage-inducible protein D